VKNHIKEEGKKKVNTNEHITSQCSLLYYTICFSKFLASSLIILKAFTF